MPPVDPECHLLFVYGILKRGFALDLSERGCPFIGKAQFDGAILYRIGQGVGLRFAALERSAYGEVFEIPRHLWKWLDGIEQNGFAYTRKIVQVYVDNHEAGRGWMKAWVYEHTFPGMKYDRPIENGVYEHADFRV